MIHLDLCTTVTRFSNLGEAHSSLYGPPLSSSNLLFVHDLKPHNQLEHRCILFLGAQPSLELQLQLVGTTLIPAAAPVLVIPIRRDGSLL